MFTDNVTIKVVAGKGGNGKLSFRARAGLANGGPDGGDGGHGGNVILRADHNNSTLSKFRSSRLWSAEAGGDGGSNDRHGKNGVDLVLTVLPGTSVYYEGQLIADLVDNGDEAVVAKGGRGGFGNAHFTSSTRQAPKMAELGERGQERALQLELKLVADVGLVGLPNAGKSTLLSVVSNARPRIADYPFTTLVPNLGVVDMDGSTFLIADIPGLIEGAAEGKGLGDEFLRHIERTKVTLHLIDITSDDLERDYKTIQSELKHYRVDLSKLPQLVVITKSETLVEDEAAAKVAAFIKSTRLAKKSVMVISAVAHRGLDELLRRTLQIVADEQAKTIELEETSEKPVISLEDTASFWRVVKDGDEFVVTGEALEGFARRSNFSQWQAKERLLDIFKKRGVLREIRRQGGEVGSKISIAGKVLEWE